MSAQARPALPEAFQSISEMLPEGMSWAYKEIISTGRLYHQWELTGERGGIHVSAWWSESTFCSDKWMGGIEGHSPIPQSEYDSGKPSQEHCWLIDKPCWHDGSSLQFREQIAPMLPHKDGTFGKHLHSAVLSVMLDRYAIWLPTIEAINEHAAKATAA